MILNKFGTWITVVNDGNAGNSLISHTQFNINITYSKLEFFYVDKLF